jgi:PAS domain S-box-containing protein
LAQLMTSISRQGRQTDRWLSGAAVNEPRRKAQEKRNKEVSGDQQMQNPLNILHLEDNRLDADLIRDTLSAQGIIANISPLQTEEEFRSSLQNGNVDLILADYFLPGFDGMTALAIARENRPELPFIFVSATIGEENVIAGLKGGATDYVFKYRLQRLGLSVSQALIEAEETKRNRLNGDTDRRQALEDLRESEQRLQTVIENLSEGLVISDLNGQLLHWNKAALEVHGFSSTEECLLKLPEFTKIFELSELDGRVLDIEQWPLPRIIRGEQLTNVEVRVRRIDRNWNRIFNYGGGIVREATGRRIAFVTITDITKRKHAEAALQTSEIRYRRLFESAKDGILILGADSGQIVDVNPYLIEMLGFSKEEFLGKELWQIGLFKDVAASRLAFAELQQRGYIRYENLPLETRDGLVRPVEFVSNSYLMGERRVIQCNVRDITERKRWEQTLQAKNIELGNANLAKDRFLASMSHELRTPLNAIIGFTGTLLMKLPGPLTSDQEHQLKTVQSSAKHLHSLINDLLDLARVESGKVEVKYEPLVCQGIVEEVAAALRPLAEGKGLEFKVKTPKSSVHVAVDRRILSQILINLSNNAIKFTEKGQVRIQLRTLSSKDQTLASIEVIDTGIGIKIEDQEKLFQAFQQVSTDHRSEGTGLGLYLSQRLAVLIKGKIEFESEYGKGSTFRLLIPTAYERKDECQHAYSSSKITRRVSS